MTNENIPIITDDKLFDVETYIKVSLEYDRLLAQTDIDKDNIQTASEIVKALGDLRDRIENALRKEYWEVEILVNSLKPYVCPLQKLHNHVSTALATWYIHIEPLIHTYFNENIQKLSFNTFNTGAPLKIRIYCDVLLNKEYSFDGYTPLNIFNRPDRPIISKILKNHEHSANLKLLVSDNSNLLKNYELFNLTETYSLAAQNLWHKLTPSNKANLILNVIRTFKPGHPEMDISDMLTNYLTDLAEYEDFKKFINLTNIFNILDKNTIVSIFANEYQESDQKIELPAL